MSKLPGEMVSIELYQGTTVESSSSAMTDNY
jgi:hypothetical protein